MELAFPFSVIYLLIQDVCDMIVMAYDNGSVTKSICSLQEWYTELPPALLRGERAQPPDMGRRKGADGCFLSRAITDEYEWFDQVKISVNQESNQGETPVPWAVSTSCQLIAKARSNATNNIAASFIPR